MNINRASHPARKPARPKHGPGRPKAHKTQPAPTPAPTSKVDQIL